MAVWKEFTCRAHGIFEEYVEQGETPGCPRGCSKRMVTREIRTAPAVRSAVMGTIDQQTRAMAHDFGLSDIKVGRDDGKSVMDNLRKGEDFSPQWVNVPGQMKPGWTSRKEAPAAVNPSSVYGVQADNVFDRIGPAPKAIPTKVVGRDATDISSVRV